MARTLCAISFTEQPEFREYMAAARNEPAVVALDECQRAKAVVFQFVEKIRMIEWFRNAGERHRPKLHRDLVYSRPATACQSWGPESVAADGIRVMEHANGGTNDGPSSSNAARNRALRRVQRLREP